jgi:hypothetical protein
MSNGECGEWRVAWQVASGIKWQVWQLAVQKHMPVGLDDNSKTVF